MFESQYYNLIDETYSNTMDDDAWQPVVGLQSEAWINRRYNCPSFFMICDCLEIKETFNSVILRSEERMMWGVNGETKIVKGVMLSCESDVSRDKFVFLVCNLISYAEDYDSVPINFSQWCNEWKYMVGNMLVEPRVYDTLSELLVLDYLLKEGYNPVWAGPDGGRHDILCNDFDVEVKSTICWANDVSIESSVIQLDPSTSRLFLCVCVLERAYNGSFTIQDVINDLVESGYNRTELEKGVAALGLDDTSTMTKRFNVVHPIRVYQIDDDFPILKDSDFVGGKQPAFVHNLRYTLTISRDSEMIVQVKKTPSGLVFNTTS